MAAIRHLGCKLKEPLTIRGILDPATGWSVGPDVGDSEKGADLRITPPAIRVAGRDVGSDCKFIIYLPLATRLWLVGKHSERNLRAVTCPVVISSVVLKMLWASSCVDDSSNQHLDVSIICSPVTTSFEVNNGCLTYGPDAPVKRTP